MPSLHNRLHLATDENMKTDLSWKKLILSLVAVGISLPAFAAEPKKVLVVTVTTGFRHSSIPTAEKIIAQLGQESGAFTVVDYARQPEAKLQSKPQKPRALAENADARAKARYDSDLK